MLVNVLTATSRLTGSPVTPNVLKVEPGSDSRHLIRTFSARGCTARADTTCVCCRVTSPGSEGSFQPFKLKLRSSVDARGIYSSVKTYCLGDTVEVDLNKK